MKRVACATLLPLLLAGGCASGGGSDYAQYFRAVRQGVSASFTTKRVTKAEAAAIPYASMSYRLEGGPQLLLVLATDANGERLWTSAAHVVLATRDGRIVRSVGLPHDVAAQTSENGDVVPPPSAALTAAFRSVRRADFPDIGIFGARLNCTAQSRQRETITILGTRIATVRVDERCLAPSLKWGFTDSYWLDPESGLAWRSIQHVHPKSERIGIEILRPPG